MGGLFGGGAPKVKSPPKEDNKKVQAAQKAQTDRRRAARGFERNILTRFTRAQPGIRQTSGA